MNNVTIQCSFRHCASKLACVLTLLGISYHWDMQEYATIKIYHRYVN